MIHSFIGEANSPVLKLLILWVMFDVCLGLLRAIKEKKTNSAIGIDGIIRKFGILGSMAFFVASDCILNFDLAFAIPKTWLSVIGINHGVGIADFFGILYIMYESISILKNMRLIDMPIFNWMNDYIDALFKKFSNELINENSE